MHSSNHETCSKHNSCKGLANVSEPCICAPQMVQGLQAELLQPTFHWGLPYWLADSDHIMAHCKPWQ
jgi:hypothetical protein